MRESKSETMNTLGLFFFGGEEMKTGDKQNDTTITIRGEEVVVDSPIAGLLELLNELGFGTLYSCAGHVDDRKSAYRPEGMIVGFYITFSPTMDEDNFTWLRRKLGTVCDYDEKWRAPCFKGEADYLDEDGFYWMRAIYHHYFNNSSERDEFVRHFCDILNGLKGELGGENFE